MKRMGAPFVAVQTAEEGMRAVESRNVGCVLLDVHLGAGASGFDMISWLRADERYRALPAIAVTACASPHDRDKMLAVGFTDWIAKPFTPDALQSMIRAHLPSSVAP